MTVRLSQSSFTGTERTEVAVGTVSDSSMFLRRCGRPRRAARVLRLVARRGGLGGFDSFGTGLVVPLAGSAALASGRGLATGAAGFSAGLLAGFSAGFWAGLGGLLLLGRLLGWLLGLRLLRLLRAATAPFAPPLAWKYFAQVGSTLARVPLVLVVHLLHEPLVGAEVGGGLFRRLVA